MINEELLEKYRYINVDDYDWYKSIEEDFIEEMLKIGIEVERIYFDVSGAQGSGACFDGYVCDWERFLKSLGYDSSVLIEHAQDYWSLTVKYKGRYPHPSNVDFDIDISLPDRDREYKEDFIYQFSPYTEDDVRSHAWYAVLAKYNSEVLEEKFIDVFQDHMYDLYKRLEKEFYYLISDKAVAETIIVNGLEV